jgi:hypothetical protein
MALVGLLIIIDRDLIFIIENVYDILICSIRAERTIKMIV